MEITTVAQGHPKATLQRRIMCQGNPRGGNKKVGVGQIYLFVSRDVYDSNAIKLTYKHL